jgi:3-oxoisoapionate decarboxylase
MLSRRQVLAMAGAVPAWYAVKSTSAMGSLLSSPFDAPPKLGGAPTAFQNNMRAGMPQGAPPGARGAGRPQSSFDIIEHCKKIGLGGVQTNPPSLDPAEIKKFRAKIESYNFHLICDPRLPKSESDLGAFENEVKAYKEAGAACLHVALTGRRYEDFDTVGPWKEMVDGIHKSVTLAEPVLRRNKIKLAMENHKGYRSPEQAGFLKKLGSEYVGVCLDFGNNLALCEHPEDTLKTLAPYTVFAHIKDMAVEEYEDGFLLSEVAMGEGILDLKHWAEVLRQKDPNMIFDLEMITRDPLKIPVYTPKYWASFDDTLSPLPGRDLAKVLDLVRKNKPKKPLPKTTGLSPEAQVKLENDLNAQCIAYARQNLGM